MKLLIKDFKNTKAQKSHICSYCGLSIMQGKFYKKSNNPIDTKIVKLHNNCFKNLSLDLTIKLLEQTKC